MQSPSAHSSLGRDQRCEAILRLLSTLKWYQRKQRAANDVVKFVHSKHPQMVDDYIHFVSHHEFNDNVIVNVIINVHHQCNIEHCDTAKRFYRNRDTEDREGDVESAEYVFYRDALDAVHCYLYHQSFNDSVHRKMSGHGRSHRFSLDHDRRDEQKENGHNRSRSVSIPTAGLFAYLEQNGMSSMDLAQIQKSLTWTEYDGSVLISNISKMTNNQSLQKLIVQYVQCWKC